MKHSYTTIFEKWWKKDSKCFSVRNYRKPWKENGNEPRIKFWTNGAKRSNGDTCFDSTLIIGYTIINYTNFDFQGTLA